MGGGIINKQLCEVLSTWGIRSVIVGATSIFKLSFHKLMNYKQTNMWSSFPFVFGAVIERRTWKHSTNCLDDPTQISALFLENESKAHTRPFISFFFKENLSLFSFWKRRRRKKGEKFLLLQLGRMKITMKATIQSNTHIRRIIRNIHPDCTSRSQ